MAVEVFRLVLKTSRGLPQTQAVSIDGTRTNINAVLVLGAVIPIKAKTAMGTAISTRLTRQKREERKR